MEEKVLEYFNGDELAANVWRSKYAAPGEETPDDMHRRMAEEFYRIDLKYQEQFIKELGKREREANRGIGGSNVKNVGDLFPELSQYGKDREELTENSIYEMMKGFKHFVPQGSVMATLGTDTVASLSNCFVIQSPKDSYSSIHMADGELIYYYKRRGGTGLDISNLRPNTSKVNNTAKTSTGAVSFMERFSNTTREVAMAGRRGALMISIHVNHPDVLDFVKIKRDLTKVTGANISVKLSDDFMEAVEKDQDYVLTFPIDLDINNHTAFTESLINGEIEYDKLYNLQYDGDKSYENCYAKRVKAKDLWEEIVKSARDMAEPGLMFWDNVLEYDPASVYDEYRAETSNP